MNAVTRPLCPDLAARIARDYEARVPPGVQVTLCPRGASGVYQMTLREIITASWQQARRRRSLAASETNARVLALRAEGWTVPQIAAEIGSTPGAVYTRLHKLRDRGVTA